ncbi:MAG: ribonuclease P protein component, partial [Candidatus Dormibacteraceae bacterium]
PRIYSGSTLLAFATAHSAAEPTSPTIKVGIGVSRRVGRAVDRNRVRRRMREAVRNRLTSEIEPIRDVVLIARPAALRVSIRVIEREVELAFRRIRS